MNALDLPDPISIAEAGRSLRTGELSPIALTEAVLARIAQTEPQIHAFVAVRAEDARAGAHRAAAELAAGQDRGPLHGIPICVKDIIDWRDLPTRCGSRVRDDVAPATTDAVVVARLRAAGAILIGKTVTQEFAAGVVSAPARNPWDPDRIPGGSSGGSAAAVAVGSCLGAIGSDTGGSIRIPASVCGVVGLKPTYGTVTTQGVFPLSWSLDTVGPLARTVEDALLIYAEIADPAHRPTLTNSNGSLEPLLATPEQLTGLRLGVLRPYFFDRLQPNVAAAIEAALVVFRDLGATIVETSWSEAVAARFAGTLISRIEAVAVHDANGTASDERLGPDLRLRLTIGRQLSAQDYLVALRTRIVARNTIRDLFTIERLDALVLPATPATAVTAERLMVAYDDGEESVTAAYLRLTMPFNTTGQPALSVPCGFDAQGLPIGLQLVGRPYQEVPLCRLGQAYEQTTTWHRRLPPLIAADDRLIDPKAHASAEE